MYELTAKAAVAHTVETLLLMRETSLCKKVFAQHSNKVEGNPVLPTFGL
jgi:hypothetical protein